MKRITIISLWITLFVLSSCTNSGEGKLPKIIDRNNMDLSVSPGADFFNYAGGNWIKNTPIPDDKTSYGTLDMIREKSLQDVNTIITETAKASNPDGSVAQKIGYLYASGMDTVTIEKLGWKPVQPLLDKIEAMKNFADVQNVIAELHLTGVSAFFAVGVMADLIDSKINSLYVTEGGLRLPDRDYYFDASAQNIRDEYVKHIANMFQLIGIERNEAENKANRIMAFETRLAKVSNTGVENRDFQKMYNPHSFDELTKKYNHIDWKSYFKAMEVEIPEKVIITHPKFMDEANILAKSADMQIWKDYLQWNVLSGSPDYLSSDFVNEDFNFNGRLLSGTETLRSRWKRISDVVSGSLGESIGQLYVEKFFPPEAKEGMVHLVGNLKMAYKKRIEAANWMTAETKQKAVEKLDAIRVKIGYPNKWKDYSSMEITSDQFYRNMANVYRFFIKDNLNKLGKEVDMDEWDMTPQTCNAYYNPLRNEIVFPAAILQPPFYCLQADDAVNYGAIGVVIGHEMTHGFDDMGRHFNKEGNMIDWWTSQDAEQFTEKADVFVEQFGNMVVMDSLKVNGKLTLGENIADNGGLNIAWDAWQMTKNQMKSKNIDGFTPEQRFFLSYAQVWRSNIRDQELSKRMIIDVHSPARIRVNGALPNIDAFYEAFNITENDPLYLSPEKRAKIW